METFSRELDLPQPDLINKEEAVKILDDAGEHKFLFEKGRGPVYVVGTSLEEMNKKNDPARLHEHILQSLIKKGMITSEDEARGGYCRIDEGELFLWGPSTFPVMAAEEDEFQRTVDDRKIQIIDQWLGEMHQNE